MDFKCYIDESGDEGIGTGGSRWFVLGALIVPSHADLQTSYMVSRIKTKLSKKPTDTLHWSGIRNHDKKLYICQELLTEQWEFCCIAVDKDSPSCRSAQGFKEKWNLYFYTTRLLVERLSWYARDHGHGKASLVLENRSNMSYDQMRDCLKYLRAICAEKGVRIAWDHVDLKDIKVVPKSQLRLLQAADCVCGAVSDALEYSPLGFVEPRYMLSLKDRLYRRNGDLFRYGLKFLPTNKAFADLQREYPWLNSI